MCHWHRDWHDHPHNRLAQIPTFRLTPSSPVPRPPTSPASNTVPIQPSAAHRLDHITLLLQTAMVCPFPGRFPLQPYFHLLTKQPGHQIIYRFLAMPTFLLCSSFHSPLKRVFLQISASLNSTSIQR